MAEEFFELPRLDGAPFQTPEADRKQVVTALRAMVNAFWTSNVDKPGVIIAACLNMMGRVIAKYVAPELQNQITEQAIHSLPMYVDLYRKGDRLTGSGKL